MNAFCGTLQQLVSSVQCCHLKGIIYRDLKPENMLFDTQGKVKIVDFGLSSQFSSSKLSAVCGSLPFAGPERFLGTDCEGPAEDVWSLGVALYHIIIGTPPLEGMDFWKQQQHVLSRQYQLPWSISFWMPKPPEETDEPEPRERGS